MLEVCSGVRVLDFTAGIPGALATMILADHGAEVIKIEPPGGDPCRRLPAAAMWNRGKLSAVLDLKGQADRRSALQLAGDADVVVQNFRPGVAERLGIGYGDLVKVNPGLIYCSITGFGRSGPLARLKGYEGIVAAKTGRMMEFDQIASREGPGFGAVPVACFGAAHSALQGIIAALYVRERTGAGQMVETSLLKGLMAFDLVNWLNWQLHRKDPGKFPVEYIGMGVSYHYLVAATADGHWLQFGNVMPHLFNAFLRCLGLEEEFKETVASRGRLMLGQVDEGFWELLLLRVREKTLAEWMSIFAGDEDVAVEVFRTTQEAMAHPQMLHNGHVIEMQDSTLGVVRQLGPFADFSLTPARIGRPAPRLGQHTSEVLSRLQGGSTARAEPPAGTLPRHALEGVTVLDLSTFIAAPQGASTLADLGARVIKIETLEGEAMRQAPGVARTFQGKESIALDLKTAEGQEVIRKLVGTADMLVHNYRPGTAVRLGLDYATLQPLNPGLIYLNAAAYGTDGPYARRPAFHPIMGAVCGGAVHQAGAGSPPPPGTPMEVEDLKRLSARLARANEGNPDPNTSLVIATALLMGLYARQRTGHGQEIVTTMLCANAYANSDDFIAYEGKPPRMEPDASLFGLSALYRLYEASDGWVFLAAPNDKEWRAACETLGLEPLLSDPRFSSESSRAGNDVELGQLLEEVFRGKKAAEWEAILTERDVSCVALPPSRFSETIIASAPFNESDLMAEVDHAVFGKYLRHREPVELSLTPGAVGGMARLGEHTRDILLELGYDGTEIEHMKAAGAVNWPD